MRDYHTRGHHPRRYSQRKLTYKRLPVGGCRCTIPVIMLCEIGLHEQPRVRTCQAASMSHICPVSEENMGNILEL